MTNTVGILAILATVALLADYWTSMRGFALGYREGRGPYHRLARLMGWSVETALHAWTGVSVVLVWLLAAWSTGPGPWRWWVVVVILGVGALLRGRAALNNWLLVRRG